MAPRPSSSPSSYLPIFRCAMDFARPDLPVYRPAPRVPKHRGDVLRFRSLHRERPSSAPHPAAPGPHAGPRGGGMFARVFSMVPVGVDGVKVDVEVQVSAGLPTTRIVGLADAVTRE